MAKLVLRAGTNGWVTSDALTRDLEALGVNKASALLVHSSLSSLGYVVGGPRAVLDALLATIGPDGTLVLPSHSWETSGRGDFSFDVRHTPSCVGAISEAFRRMPGVVRSLHPTHSVAATGPKAEWVTRGHEFAATPCGLDTPYSKLIDARGQILLLGTTLDQNTMFHTVEALAQLPYLMRSEDESFTVTDARGMTRSMCFRRHARGPDRRFSAMQDILMYSGVMRTGRVGASTSLLMECAPMVQVLLDRLRATPDLLIN